jgi:hypothetical protein
VAQVVVGGTVAALAAADAIAATGRPVRLLIPRTGVGGGFMPVERGGHVLERGMRVLELHYEGAGAAPPLGDYRADEGGHRPFIGMIDAWVRDLVGPDEIEAVETPQAFLDGRLVPEMLLSSDLSKAAQFVRPDVSAQIAREAAGAQQALGDAGLLAPAERDRLWRTCFQDASSVQHGPTFSSQFLEPFTAKVRARGGQDVVAALRRKLWVPLFWPRTVVEAFRGDPIDFAPDRPFSVVRSGGMAPVVGALLARVRGAGVDIVPYDSVHRIERAAEAVRIELSDGRVEVASRPVLGLAPGELFRAAGIEYAPERVMSVLAWVDVAEADVQVLPGFLHVIDPDVPAYRVTPGARDADRGSRVVCVELAHDVDRAAAPATARDVLERVGVVAEGVPVHDLGAFSGLSFTDPTADSVERHAHAARAWQELEIDALVTGGALAFGVDSFNDQVVQGLQAAEAVS